VINLASSVPVFVSVWVAISAIPAVDSDALLAAAGKAYIGLMSVINEFVIDVVLVVSAISATGILPLGNAGRDGVEASVPLVIPITPVNSSMYTKSILGFDTGAVIVELVCSATTSFKFPLRNF